MSGANTLGPFVPPPPHAKERDVVMRAVQNLLPDLQQRLDFAVGRRTPLLCDFNPLLRACSSTNARLAAAQTLTTTHGFPTRHPALLEQFVRAVETACIDPDVRRDFAASIAEVHVENKSPLLGAKAIQWRTSSAAPVLVYCGCFEQGTSGGFTYREWTDFFEDLFRARERLLLSSFERVILPHATEVLAEACGRAVAIEVKAKDLVHQCSDKRLRLLVAELLVTDVGKRRQLRRAEAASKKLLQDAKETIHRMHILPEKDKSNEAHSPLQLAPLDDSSFSTPTAATPVPTSPFTSTHPHDDGDDDDDDEKYQDAMDSALDSSVASRTDFESGAASRNAERNGAAASPASGKSTPSGRAGGSPAASAATPSPSAVAAASREDDEGPDNHAAGGLDTSSADDSKYARVDRFLKGEAACSPHVLEPLISMLQWCGSVDADNKPIIGGGIAKIVVQMRAGPDVAQRSLQLLDSSGHVVVPMAGLHINPPRDCTLVYTGAFEAGTKGCYGRQDFYLFLEAHFRCHERALMNAFLRTTLPAESLRLAVALTHELPIEMHWDSLLPAQLPVAQRIEHLKTICSRHMLPTLVDAIVSVVKKNPEAKSILLSLVQRLFVQGSPLKGRPYMQLLPLSLQQIQDLEQMRRQRQALRGVHNEVAKESEDDAGIVPSLASPEDGAAVKGEGKAADGPSTSTPNHVASSSSSVASPAGAATATATAATAAAASLSLEPPQSVPSAAGAGSLDPPPSQLVVTCCLASGMRGCMDQEDVKATLRRLLSLETPESERGLARVGRRVGHEAQLVAADIQRLTSRLGASISSWFNS